ASNARRRGRRPARWAGRPCSTIACPTGRRRTAAGDSGGGDRLAGRLSEEVTRVASMRRHTVTSPLWGEVAARSAAGEGPMTIENPRPPHPTPLPNGEREPAARVASPI